MSVSMRCVARVAALVAGLALVMAAAAEPATGTLKYKDKRTTLKYAWLVTGPSDVDPDKTVRRLVLSATDIGAQLLACRTFSCTDTEVHEGMTVDLVPGPRVHYWVAINFQTTQYSGTTNSDVFAARSNDPQRLAGKLSIDDLGAGGPKVDAEFDVALLKDFKVGR
ncbi:MAG: hypothetical protein ABJB04_01140 [Betaproteobacteria bacterium]